MPARRATLVCLCTLVCGLSLLTATAAAVERPTDHPSVVALIVPGQAPEAFDSHAACAVAIADDRLLTVAEALPTDVSQLVAVAPGGQRTAVTIVQRGSAAGAVLLAPSDGQAAPAWRPWPLADHNTVPVGSPLWIIGNPQNSIVSDGAATLSLGVLSGRGAIPAGSPPVRGRAGEILSEWRGPVIETDLAINDGDQGAAVCTPTGDLIGLASLGVMPSRRLPTAIPIDRLLAELDRALPPPTTPSTPNALLVPDHVRAAAQATVAIQWHRPAGPGNPSAVPRPRQTVAEAPGFQRERVSEAWQLYYHQQQVFYTDAPVSAVVIDQRHLLTSVTNLHGDAEQGSVLLPDGETLPCRVIARHLGLDLALVATDHDLPFPAMPWADEAPSLGSPLLVLATTGPNTPPVVTSGVCSARGRRLPGVAWPLLQTDALANYGSLGGPVLNHRGEAVGVIVHLGPHEQRPWLVNSGVALISDAVAIQRVLPDLIAGVSTTQPQVVRLGVRLAEDDSLTVLAVAPDSAAAAAGVQNGDRLVAYNGQALASHGDLGHALRRLRPGDTVALGLLRGDDTLTVTANVEATNVE